MFRALGGAAAPAAPSQQAAKGCEQCGQTAAQDWSGDAARREITTIARGAAAAARKFQIVSPGREQGSPGRELAARYGVAPLRCRDRTDHRDIVGIVDDAVSSDGPHRGREVDDEVRRLGNTFVTDAMVMNCGAPTSWNVNWSWKSPARRRWG